MRDRFAHDVFLSHNSQDKPRVRRLAERLRDAGLRVWFDEWLIKPGDDIYLAIERGLEAARVQVLCLSPAALGSDWVTLERSTVLFRDPTNKGRRFVPLLLADCTLPDALRRYKYVDFRKEAEEAFAELLSACRAKSEAAFSDAQTAIEKTPPKTGRPIQPSREEVNALKVPSGVHLLGSSGLHDRVITRLCWSPNESFLASGCQDGVIRIWSGDTLRLITELALRKQRRTHEIAWTPAWSIDGRLIACGYQDGAIRVWDTESGRVAFTLAGHKYKTNNVAWSPDGSTLASSADDGLVMLWDVVNRSCMARLAGHQGGINTIAWHPHHPVLASASLDNTIRLWDTESRKQVRTLVGHQDSVITVVWSPNGDFLASSSSDFTIRLWNPKTGAQLQVLEEHKGSVSCIAFSADGKLLASKGIEPDSTVRIWRTDSWQVVATIPEPSGLMWFAGLSFHPTNMRLATLDQGDLAIRLWDLDLRVLLKGSVTDKPFRYCSAKVVLLGEGAVGKTSLAHRLIEDKYVVRDRTHGMHVWRLDLPPDTDPLPQRSDAAVPMDREALLWDLAGQEDYRLIHRLFLEETALALLLVNPQKDDPFAEAGDWLKALDTASRNDAARREAARLLIFSQTDVGGMKVSNAKIERFIQDHRFAGWLATSAKTGENCSDQANAGQPSKLKKLIAENVPWDKVPWTATPRLLAELKNAVLEMRDTTDIRLLRFAELAQRLEQTLPGERFGEPDVRTAVSLLANHGLARQLKFGDLVLLQPELLNGYAGAIIRSARAHKDEIGCVLEADIYDPKFDFTGVERLKHRPDEELLLRAMVQTFLDHSLCIAEETPQGRHLVFPSQYRREKDIPRDPDIFVSYTFSGEWQTVWTTLVVRLWYSQEFEHRELWHNAAEFASPKGYTLGLKLTHKQGEGEATIGLYFDKEVEDVLKAIFIEYVHRHLAKYACEVTRDRRYVCGGCGRPFKDLDLIRELLSEGAKTIVCQKCRTEVELIDFIERRLKSDLIAQRVLAMDTTASRALDSHALEQILFGHVQAITGEANQIFRKLTEFDYGIDGEVEFKGNDGKASGKKIYMQLKSDDSYLRLRKTDGKRIFDVQNERHLEYWASQPVDVYLVIRQTDELSGASSIRWMNLTRYLRTRRDKQSRQIIFDGVKLDMEAVWKVRDEFFPPRAGTPEKRGRG